VQTVSGWFSDRSACYLACGRPVVAQDTGLSGLLPTGDGLHVFGTPEEAACCVESLVADYKHHALASRQVAADCFGSDVVLAQLLNRLRVA
jgi:hypothetical protein